MTTNQISINRDSPTSRQQPSNLQRRTLIGGALAALFTSSGRVMAKETVFPSDLFIVLLHGVYHPVVRGPNLGLTSVDLNDGTYSTTKIYPIFGIDGIDDQDKAIGNFYVQATLENGTITFNGMKCAYDLPGGAIAMSFLLPPPPGTPPGFGSFVPVSDGMGGSYLEGTFELTILEANGIYRRYARGHNHMVDKLHQLADGNFNEFCFCNITQYQFP
jgi:hypothetical protein